MNTPPHDAWLALLHQWGQQMVQAATLGAVGLVIGIGQLLHSKEALSTRIVVGRAFTGGGLGMAAGAVLAWMPDLPLIAQAGIAAALASLGTSGLERLFARLTGAKQP